MQFTPVDEKDIPQTRTRTSGVSAAFVQAFIDSDISVAQVQLESSDKKMESVRATLGNFVRRHELPVTVFGRGVNLYLKRDESAVQRYAEKNAEEKAKGNATPEAAATEPSTQDEVDAAYAAATAEG